MSIRFGAPLLLLAVSAAWAAGPPPAMRADGVPDVPAELVERLNQYQNVRAATFHGWHPEKREILIATRFGDTSQAHYVSAPGAYRRQLTFYPNTARPFAMHRGPAQNFFLFSMDEGGSEFYQLYRFDLASGLAEMLTDGESRNMSGPLSHDGGQMVFTSTKRNGRDFDIYAADPENPSSARLLAETEGYWFAEAWSPDGARVLVNRYVSINEAYPYVLDVESGGLTPVIHNQKKPSYAVAYEWAHDGQSVYLVSDHAGEFQQLFRYDANAKWMIPLSAHVPWDVEQVAISADREVLAYAANEGGLSRIRLLDVKRDRELGSPDIPAGIVSGLEFHPARNELAFTLGSARTPGDVYSYDLDSEKLTRWTFSEVGGLDTEAFPEPELIQYPTFDESGGKRREIPAFVTKPAGEFEKPHPVFVNIHGGPEGQSRPVFPTALSAYLVNDIGVAEIRPNVRGSAGYGKTYLSLDDGVRREDSVRDIGALLDWIATQPDLDETRVAVYGGSYGGYMSLAAMTHYSERLKCGIDVVGISHFGTFLKNTQDYRRDLRRAEYGDERDPAMRDFFDTISPLNNAHKIQVPVLVAQGKNDPRVPYTESEQIVEKVRENGLPVWYLLAEDEGHGFAKKPNRDYFQQAAVLFLEKYLLGD